MRLRRTTPETRPAANGRAIAGRTSDEAVARHNLSPRTGRVLVMAAENAPAPNSGPGARTTEASRDRTQHTRPRHS